MRDERRLALSGFILAFCSLNYEFLLAQMMSVLGGHTVFFYCLTIGLYIFALGIGSLIPVAAMEERAVRGRIFWVEMLLCLLGGGAPLWMIGTDALVGANGGDYATYIVLVPHVLLVLGVGLMSGMELPLVLRLAEVRGVKSLMMRLLAIDYLASFSGAVAFPLLLLPQFGVVRAAGMLALLNLAAVFLLVPPRWRAWQTYCTAGAMVAVLLVVVRGDDVTVWLSQLLYM